MFLESVTPLQGGENRRFLATKEPAAAQSGDHLAAHILKGAAGRDCNWAATRQGGAVNLTVEDLHFPSIPTEPADQDPPRQRKALILSNIIFRNSTWIDDTVVAQLLLFSATPDARPPMSSPETLPVDDRTPQVKDGI